MACSAHVSVTNAEELLTYRPCVNSTPPERLVGKNGISRLFYPKSMGERMKSILIDLEQR